MLDQDRFRRFIDLVEHYMKDALEENIKRNYYNFYNLLASYIPSSIEIISAGKVINTYDHQVEDNNSVFDVKKR